MDKKELNTNDSQQNEASQENNKVNAENNEEKTSKKSGFDSIKKPLAIASIIGVAATAGVVGTVLGTKGSPEQENGNPPPPPSNYVNFIDFTKNENGVYSAEVANTIENLDFSKCIEISENCTYKLYSDAEATQPIDDVLIALVQGYNTFYVKVSDAYGNSSIYALQVRRQNQLYLVTFNTFGGTVIETQSIEEGNFVTKPQDPVKEGYDFTGWNFDFDTPITEDITITANYTLINYEITYELDGGINHAGNHKIFTIKDAITLQEPTKAGYIFKGWYTDSEFNNQITEIEQGTTGNRTLYAKWEVETYTITYNLDDGVNNENNPTTFTIETDTITLKTPTKEGYTFAGWYADGEFNTQITSIEQGSIGNRTLYSKWELETYSITYNLNNGVNNENNPTTYTIETNTIILKTPTKEGYTFAGWYADGEFNTQTTSIEQGSMGNKTLYAKWEVETYTITYNLDNGINNSANPTSYTVEVETITLQNPTKENYTFKGWYIDAAFASPITKIEKGATGDIILYAKWEETSFTVTFNTMGGSEVESQIVKFNKTVTLPTNPTKKGYTFISWYTEESYINEWNFSTVVTKDITLYAKFNFVSYSITYNLNGGTNNITNPENYTISTETITLQKPSRDGYIFGGWYTDGLFTNAITQIPKGSYSNIILYAKWEEISYTVTFNSMGGTTIEPKIVKFNGQVDMPTSPIKNGYTFYAWYKEESFTNEWDFSSVVTEDTTLYAKYNIVNYSINYNLDGGTNNSENLTNYSIETNTITLKAPTKDGFTFGGWYTDSSFNNEITEIAKGTYGEINLYAKWESVSELIPHETFTYTRDGVITGLSDPTETRPEIPSEIYGIKITAIADDAFKNNTTISMVIINEGVSSIGKNAFSGCTNLSRVLIYSMDTIGENAFSGCSKLTRISFSTSMPAPKKVSIEYSNGSKDTCEYSYIKDSLADYLVDNYTKVTFIYESYVINYNLNGGINNSANPDTYLVDEKTITLETPTKEGYVFKGWYTESTFENQISEISNGAYGIYNLYAKWGSSIEEDNDYSIFAYTNDGIITGLLDDSVNELVIPSAINGVKITAIANEAFKDNTTIMFVKICKGITSIGSRAFSGCTNLYSVHIYSVNSIGKNAFDECSSLSDNGISIKEQNDIEITFKKDSSSFSFTNSSSSYKYLTTYLTTNYKDCGVTITYK